MNAKQYFNDVVKPTIGEYGKDRTSVRLALLSCISIIHIFDFIEEGRRNVGATTNFGSVRKFVEHCKSRCPQLEWVYLTGIAAKHAVVKQPGKLQPGIRISDVSPRPPASWDVAVWDRSLWDDPLGAVEIEANGIYHDLHDAISACMRFFESQFPTDLI